MHSCDPMEAFHPSQLTDLRAQAQKKIHCTMRRQGKLAWKAVQYKRGNTKGLHKHSTQATTLRVPVVLFFVQ